jgi:hypothetical protein
MRYRVARRIAYLRRNRCSLLLLALCLFILINPLLPDDRLSSATLNTGLLIILTLAVWALRMRRIIVLSVLALAFLTLLVLMAPHIGAAVSWLPPVMFGLTAVFIGAVTAALLRYVLDYHPVSTDKVFGAVAAYVLIAFTFALVFGMLQIVQPDAFHVTVANIRNGRLDWVAAMYFSFTVLTSTGFGEITPASDMARSLIVIEQVIGVMYVAFLVARLANLYGATRRG